MSDDTSRVGAPHVVFAFAGGGTIKKDLIAWTIGGGSDNIPVFVRSIRVGSSPAVGQGYGLAIIENVVFGEAINQAIIIEITNSNLPFAENSIPESERLHILKLVFAITPYDCVSDSEPACGSIFRNWVFTEFAEVDRSVFALTTKNYIITFTPFNNIISFFCIKDIISVIANQKVVVIATDHALNSFECIGANTCFVTTIFWASNTFF